MSISHGESVEQRLRWLRCYPEGSIEFLVVTRVLAILLLLALIMVREVQRPLVLLGIVGVLWIDFVLMLWWVAQLIVDLDDLAAVGAGGGAARDDSLGTLQTRAPLRRRIGLTLALPTIWAALVLAPWPAFLRGVFPSLAPSASVVMVLRPLLIVLFVVSVGIAVRQVRRLELVGGAWAVLLFVPVLHWLAMHRVLISLYERMTSRPKAGESSPATPSPADHGAAITISDLTWGLSLLLWIVVGVLAVVRGRWPADFPSSVIPFAGLLVFTIFAIADLAALERVQRRFFRLIRRG